MLTLSPPESSADSLRSALRRHRQRRRGSIKSRDACADQESIPGLVAAGATVLVFTGRGNTIGNAIAPVIKLASNTPVFKRMGNDLDLSAGGVIDGTENYRRGRRASP